MKVYVVTSGTYSSYTIEKVFSNRKKAETYIATLNKDYYICNNYRIETYETEDDNIEIRTDKKVWRYVAIYEDGHNSLWKIDSPLRIFESDYEELIDDDDDDSVFHFFFLYFRQERR